jgi:large subunit ribosomal protein L15
MLSRSFCEWVHRSLLTSIHSQPSNLASSGIELVLAHTMYAVVGAVSLEKGGHIANKVTRERILAPLGFKVTA